jgi:hypothetical protein
MLTEVGGPNLGTHGPRHLARLDGLNIGPPMQENAAGHHFFSDGLGHTIEGTRRGDPSVKMPRLPPPSPPARWLPKGGDVLLHVVPFIVIPGRRSPPCRSRAPSPTPRRAYGRPLHTPKRCFHSSMVLAVGSPSLRAHTVDSAVRMHIERWTNLAAIGRPAASVCPVGGVTRSVGPVRPRRRRIRSSQVSTVETLACEDPSPWSNKQWRESTKSKID